MTVAPPGGFYCSNQRLYTPDCGVNSEPYLLAVYVVWVAFAYSLWVSLQWVCCASHTSDRSANGSITVMHFTRTHTHAHAHWRFFWPYCSYIFLYSQVPHTDAVPEIQTAGLSHSHVAHVGGTGGWICGLIFARQALFVRNHPPSPWLPFFEGTIFIKLCWG